jgi:hypothetical protein
MQLPCSAPLEGYDKRCVSYTCSIPAAIGAAWATGGLASFWDGYMK